jgi:hypothetical protein
MLMAGPSSINILNYKYRLTSHLILDEIDLKMEDLSPLLIVRRGEYGGFHLFYYKETVCPDGDNRLSLIAMRCR